MLVSGGIVALITASSKAPVITAKYDFAVVLFPQYFFATALAFPQVVLEPLFQRLYAFAELIVPLTVTVPRFILFSSVVSSVSRSTVLPVASSTSFPPKEILPPLVLMVRDTFVPFFITSLNSLFFKPIYVPLSPVVLKSPPFVAISLRIITAPSLRLDFVLSLLSPFSCTFSFPAVLVIAASTLILRPAVSVREVSFIVSVSALFSLIISLPIVISE